MSGWNGAGEPTLADIQDEFPGWQAWRGISGLYYARKTGQPPERPQAEGEDPQDLRDSIVRWLALHDEQARAPEAGS